MGPETGEFSPTNSLPARLTSSADSDRLQSLDDRSPSRNRRTLFKTILAGGVAAGATLASPLGRAISALAGGIETANKPEPAGHKTANGFVWDDGKEIIIGEPLLPVDFDMVSDKTLKDVQTGQERQALPLHTELRNLLDLAGADRIVFNNNPSLAERYTNREQGVYPYTVNRANPRLNPDAIFAYSAVTMRPTDNPEHLNDIRVDFYLNPNCPTPPRGDAVINIGGENVVIPDAYSNFEGIIAVDLARVALTFKDTIPDTRLLSGSGYEPGEPVSNLAYNIGFVLPFEVTA